MSPIHLLPLLRLLLVAQPVRANEQDVCTSHAGRLLTGTVLSTPRFARGHELRGVELSHTHVRLRGDDGRVYDIAIDDVFADGYDQAGEHVPAPLSHIEPGNRLELCGKPYTSGLGMDWVHTNCGDRPNSRQSGRLGQDHRLGRRARPEPGVANQEVLPPLARTRSVVDDAAAATPRPGSLRQARLISCQYGGPTALSADKATSSTRRVQRRRSAGLQPVALALGIEHQPLRQRSCECIGLDVGVTGALHGLHRRADSRDGIGLATGKPRRHQMALVQRYDGIEGLGGHHRDLPPVRLPGG